MTALIGAHEEQIRGCNILLFIFLYSSPPEESLNSSFFVLLFKIETIWHERWGGRDMRRVPLAQHAAVVIAFLLLLRLVNAADDLDTYTLIVKIMLRNLEEE
ncbi:unnamed protein product [Diatraea saccharalis]|uniref:Uncharacterized protein n=1 Tax=Diatraea saccharalis TaxID=40085 RepID=A0A9N9R008_9NEOP|nr:unnamed protein product [Diatraea saccharalis]